MIGNYNAKELQINLKFKVNLITNNGEQGYNLQDHRLNS